METDGDRCTLSIVDRRKKLVNTHESAAKRILDVAAGRNNASVYAKIRVADVLNMERSGINSDLYSYGLKAHFDFVVANEVDMPLFAVEYDGPTHLDSTAIARDRMKNELCERLGLPLARVRDEHIFKQTRGMDYLTWLSEVYFTFQWLLRAQEEGAFPADELPDPMMCFSSPHLSGRFPLFVSAHARTSLQRWHSEGLIKEPTPLVFCGDDQTSRTNALLLLPLADGSIIISQSTIYLRWFGIAPSEAAEEIAIANLETLVKRHVESRRPGVSTHNVRRMLIEFLRNHKSISFGGYTGPSTGFNIGYHYGRRWRMVEGRRFKQRTRGAGQHPSQVKATHWTTGYVAIATEAVISLSIVIAGHS